MRGIHTFLILFGIAVVYFVAVHGIAAALLAQPTRTVSAPSEIEDSFNVALGISESVTVTVTRQRFYGKIIEIVAADSKVVYVYLFNFLKLPLRVHAINFLYFHIGIIFLIVLLFFILTALEK